MRTIRLWIAYDGTDFAGWQRQAGAPSIQEELERAVRFVTGERAAVHGAGRTDAGVHALAQAAHVRLERSPPVERLPLALNTFLPATVRVCGALEVPADFHARFSSRGKRYVYRIRTGRVPHPLLRRYAHWVRGPLDLAAMRAAARHLIGRHDFSAFATNPGHPRRRPAVRTVRSLHVWRRKEDVVVAVGGDGFLYNQVRAMAGTLLEVGRGRWAPDLVRAILASKDRRLAGPTLPAAGLFLVRVLYPPRFGGLHPPPIAR